MKKFVRRLTALALVLALVLSAAGQTAFASWALGTELVARTAQLADGVSLTAQSLWSASKSDLRTENFITYTPGSGVTPMVYSGAYVVGVNTVAAAAAALEKQGYRVIAGINGGFFNGDGTIVGMLMTEGVVRSLDLYNWTMLGFTKDGHVFIDESGVAKSVSWKTADASHWYTLAGFNAYRHNDALGGLYLYNGDFYTKVSGDINRGCVAVVLAPVTTGGETTGDPQPPEATGGETTGDLQPPEATGGETTDNPQPPETTGGETPDDPQPPKPAGVTMNGTLTLSVETVMDTRAGDAFNGVLPDGRYMLYATYYDGNDGLMNALRTLTPGQQVTVAVSGVSEQWADAAYGVSGMYTLLRGGEIVSGLPSAGNPYTAVGVKKDGSAVFYTIDGRQSGYSVGATYAQVAQRLQELGCVTAVALDGGGSTTLGGVLPGQREFELLNRPSQNGRALNNSIFLVAGDGYAGMNPGFYLSSDTQVVLSGASLNISAVGYDRWGEASSGMIPDWSAAGGTVETDGLTAVYTAGDTAGVYAVSAGSGPALPVRVVDALDSLRVTREGSSAAVSSLNVKPGDTVDLAAAGIWRNLPVAVNGAVTWTADADIGTIDSSGRFRAAAWYKGASGNITVSAGGTTATVNVTVQAGYPFTDVAGHWSADYVTRLYELGLTQGIEQPDGTYIFNPTGKLSRGELLVFITRLLRVNTDEYQDVTLPFADADTIPEWMLPQVKAMYALSVLNGVGGGGKLYAGVNRSISREETMTILGRVLKDQIGRDLSDFADSGSVSIWARAYVETLVALNVVQGSGGKLSPQADITRGEMAKLLVGIYGLEKAELTRRPPDGENGSFVEPELHPSDKQSGKSETPRTPADLDGTYINPEQRPDQSGGGKNNSAGQNRPSFDPDEWTADLPLFNQ